MTTHIQRIFLSFDVGATQKYVADMLHVRNALEAKLSVPIKSRLARVGRGFVASNESPIFSEVVLFVVDHFSLEVLGDMRYAVEGGACMKAYLNVRGQLDDRYGEFIASDGNLGLQPLSVSHYYNKHSLYQYMLSDLSRFEKEFEEQFNRCVPVAN